MKKLHAVIAFFIIAFQFVTTAHAYASETNAQMANEILTYVNQYRLQHGRPRLTMSPVLSHEATQHSHDMAIHAMPFGHNGFNARMNRLHQHIPQSSSGAENVAYNYKTAKIVVDGWINSPGHRQNLMGSYNLTGIGIARDSAGKLYYTQLFLRSNSHAVRNHMVHQRPPVVVSSRANNQHQHGWF